MNSPTFADRIYVDGSLSVCGDGESWGTAYKYLQDALDAADGSPGPHEIWVAAETYYPDENCANPSGTEDWNDTFNMITGVAILGGFDGSETVAADRDPVANETILSGDIGGLGLAGCGTGDCFTANGTPGCQNANICDVVCLLYEYCCIDPWDSFCAAYTATKFLNYNNTLHVVTANDVTATSIIDGFTITKGRCIGGSNAFAGAGMRIFEASPTVVRCIFDDNIAANGGCVSVQGGSGTSDPQFINCEFKNSQAYCYGAGMHLLGNTSATVVNSVFSNNSSVSGLYAGSGFANLSADSSGELINCVFVGNVSGPSHGGGAGVFCLDGSVVIDNCIFWDNDPYQISNYGTVDVTYSCVQDGWSGIGNIDSNPLFVDIVNGDYHLQPTSLCIDKGNQDDNVIADDFFDLDNDGSTSEPTPDLDLNNRISSPDDECQVVDMGAYEFVQGCCQWDLDDNDMVSTSDLLLLLPKWGISPVGPPDFDCDGDVDTTDLLALFANWGRCECAPPGGDPWTLEEELADACLTQADWDEYVGVMTGSANQATKDRYHCWMKHYINDCNRCSCLGASGCPAPDPFD